jgi:hypothetical protein
MNARIDDATARFLDSAAVDLQRQVRLIGTVERIGAETTDDGVTLVATICIGTDVFQVPASGDSLLTAYARLTRDVAEPMLASAFRGVLAS